MGKKKLLTYFLLLSLLLSFHMVSVGQDVRISEKYNQKPLTEILSQLTEKYNVKLAYDPVALSELKYTGKFSNDKIEKVLKAVLKNSGFEYVKINQVYVVKKSVAKIEKKSSFIQGIVRDRISGEALPYASVKVVNDNTGTVTNTDGFFTIQNMTDDSVSIEVSFLGFNPIKTKIARIDNSGSPVVVELDPKLFVISDVEVVKSISKLLALGNNPGEIVLNTRKVGETPSLSGIDVLAPLQLLPGVDGTTESLSGLLVRHSPPDKNLISYDGFTIYHINHLFGAFSSLNSKAIKDVRLYRGGFDARWGGRASSVVEITGKTGNEKKFVVDVGSDQLAGDITVEGPIGKKSSFILSARRAYTDYYRSPQFLNIFESAANDIKILNKSFTVFGTDPSAPSYMFYDANAKYSLKPNSKDVISVSAYVGKDRLNYAQLLSSPFVKELSDWGNSGIGTRWARQWNGKFYHNLTFGLSNFSSDFALYDSTLSKRSAQLFADTVIRDYKTSTNLVDYTLNLNTQFTLSKEFLLEFGLHANIVDDNLFEKYFRSTNGYVFIDTMRQSSFYSQLKTGWLQLTYKTKGLKSLKIGGRLSHHNLTDKYYFEPRVQMVLSPTEKLDLKFSAGLYNQFINRIYLYSTSVKYLWVASDGVNFPVVKSKHFISGISYETKNFTIDIEGYVKETSGLSFVQNKIVRTTNNRFVERSKLYLLDSRALGVDLLLKKTADQFEGWLAYSYSKSFNQSSSLNGGDEYYALDDHLHELKAVTLYRYKRWRLSSAWIYGSPKPWDEIILLPNLTISPDYEKNSSRLTPYHRLDVGISYSAQIFSEGMVEFGLKVFNLYNRNNILARPYSLTDTPISDYLQGKSIISYNDIYGLGRTPTIFFNIRF
ncbi:carboxypeptidase-like regulatory domain-containing protein [Tenuifilum thalassicum]|uniref:DUF4974 domain-containing protein n=1 Tax=Tenuifilum thalassicum TaxID=2590900 RepID=A0A7D4BQS2_9BACT|nr:carboxypeptidase-like regulatory domain-containing protein [Tenuifilum thalassicum]QKG79061.1 DUF4974 domain-containing protein [Tenuifilum thalassicum]